MAVHHHLYTLWRTQSSEPQRLPQPPRGSRRHGSERPGPEPELELWRSAAGNVRARTRAAGDGHTVRGAESYSPGAGERVCDAAALFGDVHGCRQGVSAFGGVSMSTGTVQCGGELWGGVY